MYEFMPHERFTRVHSAPAHFINYFYLNLISTHLARKFLTKIFMNESFASHRKYFKSTYAVKKREATADKKKKTHEKVSLKTGSSVV